MVTPMIILTQYVTLRFVKYIRSANHENTDVKIKEKPISIRESVILLQQSLTNIGLSSCLLWSQVTHVLTEQIKLEYIEAPIRRLKSLVSQIFGANLTVKSMIPVKVM